MEKIIQSLSFFVLPNFFHGSIRVYINNVDQGLAVENNEELIIILELSFVEPENLEIEYDDEFIAVRGYRNEAKFLLKSHFL